MIIGIDLGGTKIEVAVLAGNSAESVVFRKRISTEQKDGYDKILSRIFELLHDAEKEVNFQFKKIGLSHPGALELENSLIKNSNTQCLNGKPLKKDLEKLTGREIICANDANCFALAEATLGAGRNNSVVFGVIMGTGIGGGIIVDGKIIPGTQGIAGEWGHNIIDGSGPDCYCGKKSCVETLISGPALESFYERLSGSSLSLSDIVLASRSGKNTPAEKTINHLIDYFGRSLAVVINILDPDVIVLGGGLSNIAELYQSGIVSVAKYVFNGRLKTKIVKNSLGDSAGVFGAAMLTQC